jgi:hypothetical protein
MARIVAGLAPDAREHARCWGGLGKQSTEFRNAIKVVVIGSSVRRAWLAERYQSLPVGDVFLGVEDSVTMPSAWSGPGPALRSSAKNATQ